jgi:hypothetical protein
MAQVTFVHGIGNKPEPRALLDLWRRKLAQGAGAIDLGDAGVESSMVYWADVLYERPDPDLTAFARAAKADKVRGRTALSANRAESLE